MYTAGFPPYMWSGFESIFLKYCKQDDRSLSSMIDWHLPSKPWAQSHSLSATIAYPPTTEAQGKQPPPLHPLRARNGLRTWAQLKTHSCLGWVGNHPQQMLPCPAVGRGVSCSEWMHPGQSVPAEGRVALFPYFGTLRFVFVSVHFLGWVFHPLVNSGNAHTFQ